MRWRKATADPAGHRAKTGGSNEHQRRLLAISQSMENFAADLAASAEEIRLIAVEAAERLRSEGGDDGS